MSGGGTAWEVERAQELDADGDGTNPEVSCTASVCNIDVDADGSWDYRFTVSAFEKACTPASGDCVVQLDQNTTPAGAPAAGKALLEVEGDTLYLHTLNNGRQQILDASAICSTVDCLSAPSSEPGWLDTYTASTQPFVFYIANEAAGVANECVQWSGSWYTSSFTCTNARTRRYAHEELTLIEFCATVGANDFATTESMDLQLRKNGTDISGAVLLFGAADLRDAGDTKCVTVGETLTVGDYVEAQTQETSDTNRCVSASGCTVVNAAYQVQLTVTARQIRTP